MKLTETNVYGFKLLYDSDYCAVDWKSRPNFEPFMRPILEGSKGLFIDAGCNAGFHTLSAASLGMDVIAVDANYLNAALLQKTVVANGLQGKVKVVPAALSNFLGITTVDTGPSNSSIENEGIQVVKLKLDQVVEKYGNDLPVGVIKIDVEGHEEQVIQGGIEVIIKHSPVIVFEYCTHLVKDSGIFRLMERLGYDCKMVGKNEQPFKGEMDDNPMNVYMFECHKGKQ